jgi:hypothetical protein
VKSLVPLAIVLLLGFARPGAAQPPAAEAGAPVATAADLQAAIAKGGHISIAPGAALIGSFTVTVSGTVLSGNGAAISAGKAGPAIAVAPGTRDVTISDLTLASDADPVALCGRNDSTQTDIDRAPANITFARLTVQTHRGKRAFEWNCTGTLDSNTVHDTWDPAGQDSQALAILNSPGRTRVTGGTYQAGSEGILIGGDTMKMPGVVPTDIVIENLEISRPLAWKTDGVKRKVKNLLELKTGRKVVARHLTLDGSWQDGQEGWAVVVTPHSGGDIHDVTFDDLTITNVGAGFQFLGLEYSGIPTPSALSGVHVSNCHITISSADYGGRGVLALATGAPVDLTFTNNVVVSDGSSVFYYDPGTVLDPASGGKRPAGPMESLTLTGNYLVAGRYGILLAGSPNATGDVSAGVRKLTVTDNTFADAAPALEKALPKNTYVDRSRFDRLVASLIRAGR